MEEMASRHFQKIEKIKLPHLLMLEKQFYSLLWRVKKGLRWGLRH